MAAYATVTDFRAMLSQTPPGLDQDALITVYLERATAIVESALGFAFGAYGAATVRRFSAPGGHPAVAGGLLHLPYHESGSLTALVLNDVAITDYEAEAADHTWLWRADGWPRGRYEATAKWGYGPAPADVVQVTLEKAINLYIGAQGGAFSDVVGIEGAGAVGYNRAWTNSQRAIIESARLRYGQLGFA